MDSIVLSLLAGTGFPVIPMLQTAISNAEELDWQVSYLLSPIQSPHLMLEMRKQKAAEAQ